MDANVLPYLDARVYQAIDDGDRMLPYVCQSNNPINFIDLNMSCYDDLTKEEIDVMVEDMSKDVKTNVYKLHTYNQLTDTDKVKVAFYYGVEIRRKTEEERMQPILVKGDATQEEVDKARLNALKRNAVKEHFIMVVPYHPKFMVDVMVSWAPETAILKKDEASVQQEEHQKEFNQAFDAVDEKVRAEVAEEKCSCCCSSHD